VRSKSWKSLSKVILFHAGLRVRRSSGEATEYVKLCPESLAEIFHQQHQLQFVDGRRLKIKI